MRAIQRMLAAQTKLDVVASIDDLSADRLRAALKEVAADLSLAIDEETEAWGDLTRAIRRLEKGK